MSLTYEYQAIDLRTNEVRGSSLPLTGVTWTKSLMRPGSLTASYVVGADTRGFVRAATVPGRHGIHAIRNSVPCWGGICWKRSYDSSTRRVSLTYQTYDSYWAKRYQRQSRRFYAAAGNTPVPHAADGEQIAIARWLLNNAAAANGGDIGIEIDAVTSSKIYRDQTYSFWDFHTVLDELVGIMNLDNGFEYRVEIYRKSDNSIGRRLIFGSPRVGRSADTTPLVFGKPGNIVKFTASEDAQSAANYWYAVGAGEGAGQLESRAAYDAQIQAGYPLLEGSTMYKDVEIQAILNDHATADLQQNLLPITILGVMVHNGAKPGTIDCGDYAEGDYARFQIEDPWYGGTVTQLQRLSQISTTVPDQGGNEVTTLTLGNNDQLAA